MLDNVNDLFVPKFEPFVWRHDTGKNYHAQIIHNIVILHQIFNKMVT